MCPISLGSDPYHASHVTPTHWLGKEILGLRQKKRTAPLTTQHSLHTVLHPSLSSRFQTNDRQIRYWRISMELFFDTLIVNSKSRPGNNYAGVFGTSFGWSRVFPMLKKAQAHEGLSLLFKIDGVPRKLVIDGSKEQTEGKFYQKKRQANCWIKQVKP